MPLIEDPLKVTEPVFAPLQSVRLATALTAGKGLTVMLNVCAVPEQLLAVGITETVAVMGEAELFEAVNEAMLPLPLAPSPIEVVLLVQL